MECSVLAGLLAVSKLASGLPCVAILIGFAWWLGAILSPKTCSGIGVIVGLGILLGLLLSGSPGSVIGIEVVVGVWAAFAYFPIVHREALSYFAGTKIRNSQGAR